MSRAIILCEGYHDRSFWQGWLAVRHGLAGPPRGTPLYGPYGKVASGHYGYWTKGGSFLEIVPCHGDESVLRDMERRLRDRATRSFTHLVVNLDADHIAGTGPDRRRSITDRTLRIEPAATQSTDGTIVLSNDAVVVPVIWECADEGAAGIPRQQTLERLVCSSICGAHPERGEIVRQWLASCGDGWAVAEPKAHAWSMMAGWFPDRGCDDFYAALWQEPAIRRELERRLGGYLDLIASIAE